MITAVPGFLGRPADWDFLRDAGLDVRAVALDAIPHSGDILLGYSMGGRVALHAVLNGATYRHAVVVSSGIGAQPESRKAADEAWAERFENDEWEQLIDDWDAQPVFGGHRMPRREQDFDRAQLASAMRRFSPSVLPPLEPHLREIDIPVLWIAGERDAKYVAEARRAVSLLRRGELWICPGAGHRVPWEQPALFIRRIQTL